MLERDGEINVVLSHLKDAFIKSSVNVVPGAGWEKRFEAVLQQAAQVITASENRASGNAMVYEYANLLLDGLAILRAKMLDTDLIQCVPMPPFAALAAQIYDRAPHMLAFRERVRDLVVDRDIRMLSPA